MSDYKYRTDEFGLSETGVHLLRNNYNYKTINYEDITLLEIKHGKLFSNWLVVLLIGAGLIAFSISWNQLRTYN